MTLYNVVGTQRDVLFCKFSIPGPGRDSKWFVSLHVGGRLPWSGGPGQYSFANEFQPNKILNSSDRLDESSRN